MDHQSPKIRKNIPQVTTHLRQDYIKIPDVIRRSSGININGKRIKSLIFTTDLSIIANNDADAVLAVYPFTPSPSVIQGIAIASSLPIMAGVGGGTTQGLRSANMALFAESLGARAVVVNNPTPFETVKMIDDMVDIPIVMTIVSEHSDIAGRLNAGVDILNVSGGKETARIVRAIRESFPDVPIIATGGATDESIIETIEAGANAITYTPPSTSELFAGRMRGYRETERQRAIEKGLISADEEK